MSNEAPSKAEVELLIQSYLEASLSAPESEKLLAAIAADPILAREIIENLSTDYLIRDIVSQPDWISLLPESSEIAKSTSKIVDARPLFGAHAAAWLALAACVTLILAGIWLFGPKMGQPVLADVHGTPIIERHGQTIAARVGVPIQPSDRLITHTNETLTLAFGPEKTRIGLHGSTDLKLLSLSRGKHFELASGKLDAAVAHQRPFHPMLIRTAQAEARVVGTKFTVTASTNLTRLDVTEGQVRFADLSSTTNALVKAGQYSLAGRSVETHPLPATGGILREYWTNSIGDFLARMSSDPSFVANPDGSDYLERFESVPVRFGQPFGERLRGYLCPPETGEYRFFISGSLDAHLFLSRDDKPENRLEIAYSYNRPVNAGPPDTRTLPSFPLVAGRRYYIEVLGESDQDQKPLVVQWQRPAHSSELISSEFLSPFPTTNRRNR